MKKLFLFLFVSAALTISVSAQTTGTLDSAMRLVNPKKMEDALPYFTRIFESANDNLRQDAARRLGEYMINNPPAYNNTAAAYGNMLGRFMQYLIEHKPEPLKFNYLMGISASAVLATGTLKADLREMYYQNGLGSLYEASMGNYPNGSLYMVQLLRRYKRVNNSVPYADLLSWTDKAMGDSKSVMPALDLLKDYGDSWYKKELADTSRSIVRAIFNLVNEKMPDSLYRVVDQMWANSRRPFAGEEPVSYTNSIFTEILTGTNLSPSIRKAFARHLLYKYTYQGSREYSQKDRDGKRNRLMDTIRTVYSSDADAIMKLMGDFIGTTTADDIYEYANLQEVDWLNRAKTPFSGSAAFYRAAVLSGAFYTHLLASDPNAAKYVQAITDAYAERLAWADKFNTDNTKMPEGYSKTEFEKVFLHAARLDRMNIEQLRKMPAFANNQALKFHDVNTDMVYLRIFMIANSNALTQEVDAILKKLNTITPAEKQQFNFTYVKNLVSDMGFFRAFARATSQGVEVSIPTVDLTNRTITNSTVKIYPKDEDGKKKDEVLAQLKAFLGK